MVLGILYQLCCEILVVDSEIKNLNCSHVLFLHLCCFRYLVFTFFLINYPNLYLSSSKCELGKKKSIASNTDENSVYNWMAPEIMVNLPPSYYCDMYSYCAVLWEVFHGKLLLFACHLQLFLCPQIKFGA